MDLELNAESELIAKPCDGGETFPNGVTLPLLSAAPPAFLQTRPHPMHFRSENAAARFSANGKKTHLPYAWSAPRYTARTIVRRADHPLWPRFPALRNEQEKEKEERGKEEEEKGKGKEGKEDEGEDEKPRGKNARPREIDMKSEMKIDMKSEIDMESESEMEIEIDMKSEIDPARAFSSLFHLESVRRRALFAAAFSKTNRIAALFSFERRCASVGAAALSRAVRRFALRSRGRRARRQSAREDIFRREQKSRGEVCGAWEKSRRALFARMVEAAETIFRAEIAALALRAQFVCGAAHIRLAERAHIFPILFGCTMATARVCGRVAPHTLFYQMDLERQHRAARIREECERERADIARLRGCEEVEKFAEVCAREKVERAEEAQRRQLQFLVFAIAQERRRREIEIVEACERNLEVIPAIKSLPGFHGMSSDSAEVCEQSETSLHEDEREREIQNEKKKREKDEEEGKGRGRLEVKLPKQD